MSDSRGTLRQSARGIVLDDQGAYVVIRRSRPGGEEYFVVPGGGIDDRETLAQAVERECFEEMGARVTAGAVVLVVYIDTPGLGAVQRFLACRLLAIDDDAKTGHEFREEGRGSYETVRLSREEVSRVDLRPPEVRHLIERHHDYLLEAASVAGRKG